MSQPVTPYIWAYQPETGMTAGAQQNYGAVINWLSSDPYMCERIRHVNQSRNDLARLEANARVVPRGEFNEWLQQPEVSGPPSGVITGRRIRSFVDTVATSEGAQLAGAGYKLGDGRRYRKLTRDAHPFPINWQVFENGRWIPVPMSGGSANALSSYPNVQRRRDYMENYLHSSGLQMQGGMVPAPQSAAELHVEGPSVDIRSGLTPLSFARAFPPLVYEHPFSSINPLKFPKEFSPLFDPERDMRAAVVYSDSYAK